MKLGLVLTNDWELFGDGSGDYFEIQHRPLKELLATVESHGAKLTLMAEVGQQWAHKRLGTDKGWAREIADAWEGMLKETIKRKSDVQLHFHPQWLNASYSNSKWQLDLNKIDISTLPPQVIEEVLRNGKQYLDGLLRPVDPSYECIAFRAGFYCMQSSDIVVRKLLDAGILCDSSVAKGTYTPGSFDYRNAHSNYLPWYASKSDIRLIGGSNEDILEMPICTYEAADSPLLRTILPQPWFDSLLFGVLSSKKERKWQHEREQVFRHRYPMPLRLPRTSARTDESFLRKWCRILTRSIVSNRAIRLDYDTLPPKIFVKCIQSVYESATLRSGHTREIIPVVLTGHVKAAHNSENMDRILDGIRAHLGDRVIHWTLREAIRYWRSEHGSFSVSCESSRAKEQLKC